MRFLASICALLTTGAVAEAKSLVAPSIGAIATGDAVVWAWSDASELMRVDAGTLRVTHRSDTRPGSLHDLAVGEGGVWGTGGCSRYRCYYGVLMRFDPQAGQRSRPLTRLGLNPRAVTTGFGSVWVLGARRVLRIDPTTRRMVGRPIPVGRGARDIAAVAGAIRVTLGAPPRSQDPSACERVEIDPMSNRVAGRRPIACRAGALAVGFGSVWVAGVRRATRYGQRPRPGRVLLSRLDAEGRPSGPALGLGSAYPWLPRIAVGAGAVWVANAPTGTITRVDPDDGAISRRRVTARR